MIYTELPQGLCAPIGFTASGTNAAIKPGCTKPDMMLVKSSVLASAAAVYTKNKVKGAPILVSQENLQNGKAQAILANSGNANTCAPDGYEFAKWSTALAAKETGLDASDFILASTGVIGQALPKKPFETGIPTLARTLSQNGGSDAATAILTTDTTCKEFAIEFILGGKTCRMAAAAKGSGMININMATMLCFVTCDAAISPLMLQKALTFVCNLTLNQVCVDGDTSTNDTCAVLSNGLCGNVEITTEDENYAVFCAALKHLLTCVSRALAADGEGATKLLSCTVSGAPGSATARAIAKTIVASSLFKAAMFGQDANWGRVLCAIGYAQGNFAVDNISVTLQSDVGSVLVCKNSAHNNFSEEEASRILACPEIDILVDMGSGNGTGTAWGCDLSYDYVKINGDYRS